MKVLVRTGRNALALEEGEARAAFAGFPPGTVVQIDVNPKQDTRSLRQLRLWWSMCASIADAVGEDSNGNVLTREKVSNFLKVKCGHADVLFTKTGEEIHFPLSIAFEKLDQPAFNDLMSKATAIVCQEWLPHMRPSELRNNIERMLIG